LESKEKNPGGGRRSQHPSHFETRLSMIGYDVEQLLMAKKP